MSSVASSVTLAASSLELSAVSKASLAEWSAASTAWWTVLSTLSQAWYRPWRHLWMSSLPLSATSLRWLAMWLELPLLLLEELLRRLHQSLATSSAALLAVLSVVRECSLVSCIYTADILPPYPHRLTGLGRRDLPQPTPVRPAATAITAMPTPAPTAPARSNDPLQHMAANAGVEAHVLQRLLHQYGFGDVSDWEPVEEFRRKRDLRLAEERMLKKRGLPVAQHEKRVLEGTPSVPDEHRQKRWGARE